MARRKRANPFSMSTEEWWHWQHYDSFRKSAVEAGLRMQWDTAKDWEGQRAVYQRAWRLISKRKGLFGFLTVRDPKDSSSYDPETGKFWVVGEGTRAGARKAGSRIPKLPKWLKGVPIFAGASIYGEWSSKENPMRSFKEAFWTEFRAAEKRTTAKKKRAKATASLKGRYRRLKRTSRIKSNRKKK